VGQFKLASKKLLIAIIKASEMDTPLLQKLPAIVMAFFRHPECSYTLL